jgi:hypothetical protein
VVVDRLKHRGILQCFEDHDSEYSDYSGHLYGRLAISGSRTSSRIGRSYCGSGMGGLRASDVSDGGHHDSRALVCAGSDTVN